MFSKAPDNWLATPNGVDFWEYGVVWALQQKRTLGRSDELEMEESWLILIKVKLFKNWLELI